MELLAFLTIYSMLLLSVLIVLIAFYHFSNWRNEIKETVDKEFSLFDTTDANNKVYMLKN